MKRFFYLYLKISWFALDFSVSEWELWDQQKQGFLINSYCLSIASYFLHIWIACTNHSRYKWSSNGKEKREKLSQLISTLVRCKLLHQLFHRFLEGIWCGCLPWQSGKHHYREGWPIQIIWEPVCHLNFSCDHIKKLTRNG